MRTIDITGQKFGKLTAIKFVESRKPDSKMGKEQIWLFNCDCGQEYKGSKMDVRRGKVNSCGCNRKLFGDSNREWKGHKEIGAKFWNRIRTRSVLAGKEHTLMIEFGWELFLKQDRKCAISGIPLQFSKTARGTGGTASLDRIDSSRGYVEDNVQWVHKDVNKMKMDFDQAYFIKVCKLISKNNKK